VLKQLPWSQVHFYRVCSDCLTRPCRTELIRLSRRYDEPFYAGHSSPFRHHNSTLPASQPVGPHVPLRPSLIPRNGHYNVLAVRLCRIQQARRRQALACVCSGCRNNVEHAAVHLDLHDENEQCVVSRADAEWSRTSGKLGWGAGACDNVG